MAIIPTSEFPGKIAAADASYPHGKARDITTPGDGTGTPFRARLLNDVWGFFQNLLQRSFQTPSGSPDTALVSQYAQGIEWFARHRLGLFALNRWTPGGSGSANNWRRVEWSSSLGLFGALIHHPASTNVLATSANGIAWTGNNLPATNWLGLLWANSQFLVCGNVAGSSIATSPNGSTWTVRTTPAGATFWTIGYGAGLYVGLVYGSVSDPFHIATSPDGITWTTRTAPNASGWFAIEFSPELSLFVAFGDRLSLPVGTHRSMTSPDGITWTSHPLPTDDYWSAVAWSPGLGLFVGVCNTLIAQQIITSPDGITWTQRTAPVAARWNGVKWLDRFGLFLAYADDGEIMVSADAITWTTCTGPTVAAGNQFVGGAFSPELERMLIVNQNTTSQQTQYSL